LDLELERTKTPFNNKVDTGNNQSRYRKSTRKAGRLSF